MPRHKQLVSFQFILVLFIASVSNAQPDIVCKPANIQGRIVDEVGEPIGGAKVLVQNAPYTQDLEWYATRPEEDLLIGQATSDADGRYRIQWRVDKISAIENTNVSADILVMKPNYAIAFRQATLWREHYFQFKLKPDVEHIGKVLDDNGQPLADAEIRLDAIYNDVKWVDRGAVFSMGNDVCSMIGSTLRPRAKTDKEGNYRLAGLSSGQIALLQVTHPRFPPIRRMQPADDNSPKAIEERPVRQVGDNIFAPWYNSYRKPLQMIPGKLGKMLAIEESTGKPLADLEVCRDSSGISAKSDQEGNLEYWLANAEPNRRELGNYKYYARGAGDLHWSPAHLIAAEGDNPAKLLVPHRRTITGHVRDKEANKGIEGVGVYFVHSNEKWNWTTTDREGKYTLSTYNRFPSIAVCGPVMGYDLPVNKMSTSTDEASRELDSAVHRRGIRFQANEIDVEADFEIQRHPKLRVSVVDTDGKPVRGTQVKFLANFSWVPRPSTATSDDNGIAEFSIDRPIVKSTAWIANKHGFGVALIEGIPEGVTTLTVVPAIAIPGLLTARAADGSLRNAIGIPIYLKPVERNQFAQMDLATTDKNGHFTVYLPAAIQEDVTLFVPTVNASSNYDWSVQIFEGSRADFVMDDDRLPK